MQVAANDDTELFKLDLLRYYDACRARPTPSAAPSFSQVRRE
jgi:hypothetical protein